MAYANSIRTAEIGFGDRVGNILKTLREAQKRRGVYRQTVRELNTLSARELNDLGIHRSMIARIAHEAAYGK